MELKYYAAALDIGAYQVRLAFQEKEADGTPKGEPIVYVTASEGCREGYISNNLNVVNCIERLVDQLSQDRQCTIREVLVVGAVGEVETESCVASRECKERNVDADSTYVSEMDVKAVTEQIGVLSADVKTKHGPTQCVLIDSELLTYYKIAGKRRKNLIDPVGEYASELYCDYLVFIAQSAYYKRLISAVESAGLECSRIVLEGRAAAKSLVAERGRRDDFQVILHIGYSKTELLVLDRRGVLCHYDWIKEGGRSIVEGLQEESISGDYDEVDEFLRNVLDLSKLNFDVLEPKEMLDANWRNERTYFITDLFTVTIAAIVKAVTERLELWYPRIIARQPKFTFFLSGGWAAIPMINDLIAWDLKYYGENRVAKIVVDQPKTDIVIKGVDDNRKVDLSALQPVLGLLSIGLSQEQSFVSKSPSSLQSNESDPEVDDFSDEDEDTSTNEVSQPEDGGWVNRHVNKFTRWIEKVLDSGANLND